ncbi:hypothetical protein [Pajaroellobacter abortibovis]|uniref:hypothetical protein n=1 Tax=Pajaroellobacter abortibovis TaxID=1882918 RepID=UPI0012EB94CA|nr:hypothetical protein [Pajaroellobacter abortibovis]
MLSLSKSNFYRDPNKRFSWSAYLINPRAHFHCPTSLLVIAPPTPLAQWCNVSIHMGHPNFIFSPIVLDPYLIPSTTHPSDTDKAPGLAVLPSMIHGHLDIALASLAAIKNIDEERSRLYADSYSGSPQSTRSTCTGDNYELRTVPTPKRIRKMPLLKRKNRKPKTKKSRRRGIPQHLQNHILHCPNLDQLDH